MRPREKSQISAADFCHLANSPPKLLIRLSKSPSRSSDSGQNGRLSSPNCGRPPSPGMAVRASCLPSSLCVADNSHSLNTRKLVRFGTSDARELRAIFSRDQKGSRLDQRASDGRDKKCSQLKSRLNCPHGMRRTVCYILVTWSGSTGCSATMVTGPVCPYCPGCGEGLRQTARTTINRRARRHLPRR